MRRLLEVFAVLLLATAFGTLSAQTPQSPGGERPLTNADVVKVMKLGLGDDVIIAKINQARAIDFDLSPDGLTKLKSDGVSKDVIAAMLKRASPPSQSAPPASQTSPATGSVASDVRLRSKDSEIQLVGRRGELITRSAVFTFLRFVEFPGATSKTRVADHRPMILARLQDDPKSSLTYLVKLESDMKDDKRTLKIGKGKAFSVSSEGSPDSDWTVPFDYEQESAGVWRIVPKADLKPGEYGFFIGGVRILYDFGVDQ